MKLNNLIQFVLITYNRKERCLQTLKSILADNSPVKDIPLTVLDNASTDGTGEMIQHLQKTHGNIIYIRHSKNIGGNANIARAFEMATARYVWVLCDDDEYDLTYWHELELALKNNPPAVVVANYNAPEKGVQYLFKQLSFVPAAIYRTDLITADVLMNMYFNISNMFPQLAVAAAAINTGEKLPILQKPLVTMKLNPGNDSYVRGAKKINQVHPLLKNMFWAKGYLSSIPMLQRADYRQKCSFFANAENENFYNFCGRYLANGKGLFHAYSEGVHLSCGWGKCAFALLAPIAYCCSFFKDEKGLNIRLFGHIKTRIWKFKNN